MTKHYHEFTSRDFVLDEAFRHWVLHPDEESMTFWHTFMLKHPEQQPAIDEAASMLLHLRVNHDNLTDSSEQRIFQVLEQAFDEQHQTNTPVRRLSSRFSFMTNRVIRLAASLTGLLVVAGGAVWYLTQPRQERIHTAYGENRSVTLPDGSTVVLNGNSTLTFASEWTTDESREVWLDGEGFFKVTKQRSQAVNARQGNPIKFVTHTPSLDITVLGTQFNVNTRRGNTAVTLVEGRVQLSKPGKPTGRVIEMKPGQVASVKPSVEQVAVRTEKPQLHTAWVENQFVFENTLLSDIAQDLQDTYGLELIFEDDELAARRFTGNLRNEDVETLLTTITTTFDLRAERDDDRIYLRRTQNF